MENRINVDVAHDESQRPMSEVARELTDGLTHVIEGEIQLAKAELAEATTRLKSHALQIGIFGGMAALGTLPLVAFLVIGLGSILGGNYWLSSLIIGVIMSGIGGALAYRAVSQMKNVDVTLPRTRRSLEHEKEVLSMKVARISDATKRRVA